MAGLAPAIHEADEAVVQIIASGVCRKDDRTFQARGRYFMLCSRSISD
jgi:Zn-dependent alcohol dehydrogenase